MFLKCTWLPAYLIMANTQAGRWTTAMALILCPWLCSPRELEFISAWPCDFLRPTAGGGRESRQSRAGFKGPGVDFELLLRTQPLPREQAQASLPEG